MNLDLWHLIVTTTMEVRMLLDSALPERTSASLSPDTVETLSEAERNRLRSELLGKLGELRAQLRGQLSDKEAGMVLLPLCIHVDELVMRLFPPSEQAKWPLLQRELFDVLHGGQVFFDFVDERLHMPDTPQLVIDVLYFCLSDGFAGKFRDDPSRLEQYKRQLSERIPHPTLPQVARKRRAKEEAELQPAAPPPIRAVWLYVGAAAVILILFGLTALLTNL